MKKRKINLYLKDSKNQYYYEFSSYTNKTLSQVVSSFAVFITGVGNIKKHNHRFIHFNKPINDKRLKAKDIVMMYATYKD